MLVNACGSGFAYTACGVSTLCETSQTCTGTLPINSDAHISVLHICSRLLP